MYLAVGSTGRSSWMGKSFITLTRTVVWVPKICNHGDAGLRMFFVKLNARQLPNVCA